MQSPKLDVNGVLLVGGLIAGGYIVYKISKFGGSIGDSVKNAVDGAAAAINKTAKTAASGLAGYGTNIPANPKDSVSNVGLSDLTTFNGIAKADPFDTLDPMYTQGKVYTFNVIPSIVANRMDNPFSFL